MKESLLSEGDLNRAFSALADPTRRAILARLCRGEAAALEVARPFAMSQPAVSKHLQVLEHAGLISRRPEAQRRMCRLEPGRLGQVAQWLGTYREFWEESFERLDGYVETLREIGPQS